MAEVSITRRAEVKVKATSGRPSIRLASRFSSGILGRGLVDRPRDGDPSRSNDEAIQAADEDKSSTVSVFSCHHHLQVKNGLAADERWPMRRCRVVMLVSAGVLVLQCKLGSQSCSPAACVIRRHLLGCLYFSEAAVSQHKLNAMSTFTLLPPNSTAATTPAYNGCGD